MSDPVDIERALITAVKTLALPYPIQWEGVVVDPAQTGVYLDVTHMPGASVAVTLGMAGEDEHVGVYQVDIAEPVDTGGATTDAIIKQLYEFFVIGRGFAYNGVTVIVTGFARSPRRKDTNEARNRVAVSIFWRANLQRNTF